MVQLAQKRNKRVERIMHELGITLEIFELIEEIIEEQKLKKVSSVTVTVGELSGVLPDYFKECWNAARLGTVFESTELEIEFIPAKAKCSCGCIYEMQKNNRICPECQKTDYEIIKGREFTVKQIEAC